MRVRLGSFVAKTAYPSPIKGEEGTRLPFPAVLRNPHAATVNYEYVKSSGAIRLPLVTPAKAGVHLLTVRFAVGFGDGSPIKSGMT